MPNNEFFQTDAFAESYPVHENEELEDKTLPLIGTFPSSAFNNNYTINCFNPYTDIVTSYHFQDNTVKPIHGINDTPYPSSDVINFQPVTNIVP